MAHGKFIAYYRVSTAKQGASGLGLEAQREAVRHYLNGGSWAMVDEVTEVESGKRKDRPALAHALSLCRIHNATLVIAKLDRLSRNVNFISNLMEAKVDFIAVDFPTANRLTIHILAAVAEHEAEMISARTKAGLAQSKKKLGGVRVTKAGEVWDIGSQAAKGSKAGVAVRQTVAERWVADILPVIQAVKAAGKESLRQIADELTKRNIPTSQGASTWSAAQVKRVLDHPLAANVPTAS